MKIKKLGIILSCLFLFPIKGMRYAKKGMKTIKIQQPIVSKLIPRVSVNQGISLNEPFIENLKTKNYSTLPQKASPQKQSGGNWFTNFFKFKKQNFKPVQESTEGSIPHTNFGIKKFEVEQEAFKKKSLLSTWQLIRRLTGLEGKAAVIADQKVVIANENNSKGDILLRAEFMDFRRFVEFVRDPDLEGRWNICKKNPACNKVICEANFITIIDSPPYIVLKDHQYDRVINAKLCEQVIKDNNLDLITIPKKTILFDGKSWKVVTELINVGSLTGIFKTKISHEEFKQLATFLLETGYSDYHKYNLVRNKNNGKIVIIDTEDRSFNWGYNYDKYTLLDSLRFNLKEYLGEPELTTQWIKEQMKLAYGTEGKKPLPKDELRNRSLINVRAQAIKYADLVNRSHYSFNVGYYRAKVERVSLDWWSKIKRLNPF